MFVLFTARAASELCTLHIIWHLPDTYFTVTVDDDEKFSSVYEKVAEILNVSATSFKIIKGRHIPPRCLTLKQNDICNNTILSIKSIYYERPIALKPVIYLYPTQETEVTVSVHPDGEFVAVYPSFTNMERNEWKVHASPSGMLTVDGREFTSLFWEAEIKTLHPSFETGFIVTKENAVAFLEEKLRILGLTDKEANEFITYWLPVFNKNGKSVASFQFDNYEKAAPLLVSPKPDTVIRIFISIRKAEGDEQIKEQVLPTFKRQGYTVVEWGGSTAN